MALHDKVLFPLKTKFCHFAQEQVKKSQHSVTSTVSLPKRTSAVVTQSVNLHTDTVTYDTSTCSVTPPTLTNADPAEVVEHSGESSTSQVSANKCLHRALHIVILSA